ncbi:MAG: hypothetical protein AAF222_16005 [Pseudomonadota bacterium]
MSDLDYTPEERARVEAMADIWHDVMSKGDKSTAFGVLSPPQDPDSDEPSVGIMMTSRGSPNDQFWSQMLALGWAVEDEAATENLPMREKFVAFKLTEAGKPMLAQFLQAVV